MQIGLMIATINDCLCPYSIWETACLSANCP